MAVIGEVPVDELATVFDLDLGIEQRESGGGVRLSTGLIQPRTISTLSCERLPLQAEVGEGAVAVPVVDTSRDLSATDVEQARS